MGDLLTVDELCLGLAAGNSGQWHVCDEETRGCSKLHGALERRFEMRFDDWFLQVVARETFEGTGVQASDVDLVAITNDALLQVDRHYITIWMRGSAADFHPCHPRSGRDCHRRAGLSPTPFLSRGTSTSRIHLPGRPCFHGRPICQSEGLHCLLQARMLWCIVATEAGRDLGDAADCSCHPRRRVRLELVLGTPPVPAHVRILGIFT